MKHLLWILLLIAVPARAQFVYPVAHYQEVSAGEADLWACYDLDNGAETTDSSVNGRDLTLSGTTTDTTGVDGTANGAQNFDGSDYYWYGPAGLPASPGRTDSTFSVSIWVWLDNFAGHMAPIADYGASQTLRVFQFDSRSSPAGQMLWTVLGPTATTNETDNGDIEDTWVHWVGTYDGVANLVCMYVNGSLSSACSPFTEQVNDPGDSANLNIGGRTDGSHLVDGKIDMVRLYTKTLDATDVTNLYNSGSGRDCTYALP